MQNNIYKLQSEIAFLFLLHICLEQSGRGLLNATRFFYEDQKIYVRRGDDLPDMVIETRLASEEEIECFYKNVN